MLLRKTKVRSKEGGKPEDEEGRRKTPGIMLQSSTCRSIATTPNCRDVVISPASLHLLVLLTLPTSPLVPDARIGPPPWWSGTCTDTPISHVLTTE